MVPAIDPRRRTSIAVEQGVKQGCPLSPLLFILVIDPLLSRLDEQGLVFKGFFDDVGTLVSSVGELLATIRAFAEFGEASGLELNLTKSVLLPSIRQAAREKRWRKRALTLLGSRANNNSLPFATSSKYLGFLIGRGLTSEDVFEAATAKAVARARSYGPAREGLSVPHRVIIANAFIHTVLGYLGRLYTIPSKCLQRVNAAVAKFVVPAKFFPVELLHRRTSCLGLRTPLHKLQYRNAALILSRGVYPAELGGGAHHPLHPATHRRAAQVATLRLQPRHLGRAIEADWHSASTLYRAFLDSVVEVGLQKRALARKLRLLFRGQGGDCEAYTDALLANASLIPSKTHNCFRYHHMRLLYNAAPTGRRTRFWSGKGGDACHLCGNHEDSAIHLYLLCGVVADARRVARERLKLPPVEISFLGSLLLQKVSAEEVTFTLHFNYAVWKVRRWYEGGDPNPQAAKLIANYACASLRPGREAAEKAPLRLRLEELRAQGRKRERHRAAVEKIRAIPRGGITLYTDGSANPNPGPCGAGVYCPEEGSGWYQGLGLGTNNLGELYAVGMAVGIVERSFPPTLLSA